MNKPGEGFRNNREVSHDAVRQNLNVNGERNVADIRRAEQSSSSQQVMRTNGHEKLVNSQEAQKRASKKQKKSWQQWFSGIARWIRAHRLVAVLLAVVVVAVIAVSAWMAMTPQSTKRSSTNPAVQQYEKRLPELKKAVEKDSKDANARKEYAVALYATGEIGGAATQYEAAVKLNDKDAVAYNNLGNSYRDLKKTDKAIEAYKKSIELNKKNINAYANLANVQLYTKNDADAAIATYQQGLKELPNNTQLLLLLGTAYEQKNDTANAKSTYRTILSQDSDNAAAKAAIERLSK